MILYQLKRKKTFRKFNINVGFECVTNTKKNRKNIEISFFVIMLKRERKKNNNFFFSTQIRNIG